MILRAGFQPRKRDSDYELLETEVLREDLPTPVPLQPDS